MHKISCLHMQVKEKERQKITSVVHDTCDLVRAKSKTSEEKGKEEWARSTKKATTEKINTSNNRCELMKKTVNCCVAKCCSENKYKNRDVKSYARAVTTMKIRSNNARAVQVVRNSQEIVWRKKANQNFMKKFWKKKVWLSKSRCEMHIRVFQFKIRS